ncbi:MAG TPA: hypothetical protein VMX35_16315 [Acidobacteriota bacterium]|nr:hypothetical protein [Acidobacteriota bacterium]
MKDPLQTQQTPYEVLGIERDASDSEIIGAFKKGMLNPRRMKEITLANKMLMDPVSRAGTDLLLYDTSVLERLTPSPINNEKILEPGQRLATAKAWERALAGNTADHGLKHSIALLWYWWARYEEERVQAMLIRAAELGIELKKIEGKAELLLFLGEAEGLDIDPESGNGCPESFEWRNDCLPGIPPLGDIWKAAIGYWVMLVSSDAFCDAFDRLDQRQRNELRRSHGVEMLKSSLQKYNSEYRNRGAISMAALYKELILSLSVEQKTARAMSSAGVKVGAGAPLSCGALALERLGLIDQIRSKLDKALEHYPDNETLRSLRDSLSPHSRIATLIDDGKFEEALEAIAGEKKSDETNALKAKALFGLGMDLESAGESNEAMEAWEKALKAADDPSLKDKIRNAVSESCTKHAAAKADTDLEGGIRLLRRGYKLVASEKTKSNLAELLTRRGIEVVVQVQQEFEKNQTPTKSMISKAKKGVADLQEARKLGSQKAAEQLSAAENFLDILKQAMGAGKHQKKLETALKNQDWDDAIDILRQMRNEVSGEARNQIEKNMAVCYLNRAGKKMEVIQREMSSSSPDLWTLKSTLQAILEDLGEAKKLDPYNAEVDNFLNSIAGSPLAQILTMDDLSGYSVSSQPTSYQGYSSYSDAVEKVMGWLLLGAVWLGMAIIIFGLLYLSALWNPDFNPDDILGNSLTALGGSAFLVLMYKLNS